MRHICVSRGCFRVKRLLSKADITKHRKALINKRCAAFLQNVCQDAAGESPAENRYGHLFFVEPHDQTIRIRFLFEKVHCYRAPASCMIHYGNAVLVIKAWSSDEIMQLIIHCVFPHPKFAMQRLQQTLVVSAYNAANNAGMP